LVNRRTVATTAAIRIKDQLSKGMFRTEPAAADRERTDMTVTSWM